VKSTGIARVARLAWAVFLAIAGCQRSHGTPPDASAVSTSSRSSAPQLSEGPTAAAQERPRSHPPCRIMALQGDVRAMGPLSLHDAVPDAWIDLGEGAQFVARDPHTARETLFRGAGHARACVGLSEESWLATGRFESAEGAGESPGAEEWVVTALGVTRYNAAKVVLTVRPETVTIDVAAGVVFVRLADDARSGSLTPDAEGWARLEKGQATVAAKSNPLSRAAALSATTSCLRIATESRDLAVALLTGRGGAGDAGAIASEQVRARRLARAACGVAELRAQTLPDSDRPSVLLLVDHANSVWRTLPTRAQDGGTEGSR